MLVHISTGQCIPMKWISHWPVSFSSTILVSLAGPFSSRHAFVSKSGADIIAVDVVVDTVLLKPAAHVLREETVGPGLTLETHSCRRGRAAVLAFPSGLDDVKSLRPSLVLALKVIVHGIEQKRPLQVVLLLELAGHDLPVLKRFRLVGAPVAASFPSASGGRSCHRPFVSGVGFQNINSNETGGVEEVRPDLVELFHGGPERWSGVAACDDYEGPSCCHSAGAEERFGCCAAAAASAVHVKGDTERSRCGCSGVS